MGETAIYRSKAPKKKATLLTVGSIILVLVAIGCFALSGAKREKTTIKSGYWDGNGNIVVTDEKTGYFGSGDGYVFTEDGRKMLSVAGYVFLFVGIASLFAIRGMKRCYLEIYSDHVSGVKYTLSLAKKRFSFPYEKIESVSFYNGIVTIKAGTPVTIACENDEEAYNQLWPYCPHK